ncbi:unnamed protein product, partial [Staurois parvus]
MVTYCPGPHELSVRPWSRPIFSFQCYHTLNDNCAGRTDHLEARAPGTFFIGFFEFGQGQRGPMIPYCPGAP